MPHEPTLAELREKKKKNDAYITRISQRTHALGDTIRAQEKNLKMFDRKERTHRLCMRGGMLESFLHDASALTDEQVMETNKLLAYLRKGFRTLRAWAAEKIKEAKERHEQKQIEKQPPINDCRTKVSYP